MNATTFFSEKDFNNLKKDIKNHRINDLLDTPYGKKIKIKRNTYELKITTGYYRNGRYHITGWIDYHYAHNIGGGNCLPVVMESWEEFKKAINKVLERFPDYTEDEKVQIEITDDYSA